MAYGTLALALWHKAPAQLARDTLAPGARAQGMARLGTVVWRGVGMARQGVVSKAHNLRHPGTGALANGTQAHGVWHTALWLWHPGTWHAKATRQ
jgi:hypothetical protein